MCTCRVHVSTTPKKSLPPWRYLPSLPWRSPPPENNHLEELPLWKWTPPEDSPPWKSPPSPEDLLHLKISHPSLNISPFPRLRSRSISSVYCQSKEHMNTPSSLNGQCPGVYLRYYVRARGLYIEYIYIWSNIYIWTIYRIYSCIYIYGLRIETLFLSVD